MTSEDNTTDDLDFDLKKKKKIKKRINHEILPAVPIPTDNLVEDEPNDYSYEYLISRAFAKLDNGNSGNSYHHPGRIIIAPPHVGRIGTRRTAFTNFGVICKTLKRQEKLLHDFFVVELGTTASIDANHALIIKGRFSPTQIETVLRSFIKEYVICKTCRSPDTFLKKEERLTMIICDNCHSQYSVSTIKTGNHSRRA